MLTVIAALVVLASLAYAGHRTGRSLARSREALEADQAAGERIVREAEAITAAAARKDIP
jgi:hypothetical protein